jgi:hypothetical protein
MTVLMTTIGIACIYAGYLLFCGLPAARTARSRARVFVLNVLPGALLALIGMTVVTAQLRSLMEPRPVGRQHAAERAGLTTRGV